LASAFKAHDSWIGLTDVNSDFVKFLKETCHCNDKDENGEAEAEHDDSDPHISI
jgi:hypothetical protein